MAKVRKLIVHLLLIKCFRLKKELILEVHVYSYSICKTVQGNSSQVFWSSYTILENVLKTINNCFITNC